MVTLALAGRDGLCMRRHAARITRAVVKKAAKRQVDLRRGTLLGRHCDDDMWVVVGEGYQVVSDITEVVKTKS